MKVKLKSIENISTQIIVFGLILIITIMPFHAFISVVLGNLGIDRVLVQSWKEVVVLIMSFAWMIYQLSSKKLSFKLDLINLIFISIIVLSVLITLLFRPNSESVLFGIKTNLVALALFFIAQIPISSKSFLKKNIHWIIIIPGLIVSILAAVQAFMIPSDLLEKIGYSASTINPKQIIDGSINFYRSFSTLGGPNQMGAYLLLPLAFSLAYGIKQRKWYLIIISLPILVAIALSFSRSAWIGAFLTFFTAVFISVSKRQKIFILIIGLVFTFMVSGFVFTQIGSNERLQNILLHGRVFEGRIEGSDSGRLNSIAKTASEVVSSPFGHGLGSAGPASFKSDNPVIPENWYLQIAYEIGLLGLILYIFAFAALLGEFIRDRGNPLAISLFSATVGILVINIFLQAWADSTIVLITFALYGIYRSRNQ